MLTIEDINRLQQVFEMVSIEADLQDDLIFIKLTEIEYSERIQYDLCRSKDDVDKSIEELPLAENLPWR